jgi:hypothetical protein
VAIKHSKAVRIDNLPYSNRQTQGAQRREWLRQHAPQHLSHCSTLILHGLQQRSRSAAQNTLILGAGACTEIPLSELTRASDEVVLVDLDREAMRQALSELAAPSLRKRIRSVVCDISGGISANLGRHIEQQDWKNLVSQGPAAVFDTAAQCLEQCTIPDPPELPMLGEGEFGLVLSSLVLSQLFSYPILDLLDHIQQMAPNLLGEQERHRRYQEAAQAFRVRIINAHLHLLHSLLDKGGIAVLLSDIRGFAFNVYGTDHDAQHRRTIPLVPRIFPELVRSNFSVVEEAKWEWITDLPEGERLGRGYEVVGYVLRGQS